ncbi:retron St85 family RNA-directed DNA polymerase [Alkalibacterium sp. m-11]|uniref:RNA-directed DNA polymerase n=1 Tax=Alkalibacterium indicireducens TaxID=398758 RepID=A0ABP3KHA9_9LACT
MDWNTYKERFIYKAKRANKNDEYIKKNLSYAQKLYKKNIPIIYDITHLSLLVGVNLDYIMSVAYSPNSFYRTFQIKKYNGNKRTISEPLPLLKDIQKWILTEILEQIEVSKFAKAYISNVSLKENARFHKNKKIVLKLDIKNFFGSFQKVDVFKLFKELGYSKDVATTLTNLCVLKGSLPQGASTSPYLSNILMKSFDTAVSKYCINRKIMYTRYADDMTFSGEFNISKLIKFIRSELKTRSMELNEKKTRTMYPHQRQEVTGITVNKKMQISKSKKNNIRLEVYYIEKLGINNHIKNISSTLSPEMYLKSLLGKVEYGLFINPDDNQLKAFKKSIKRTLKEF